MTIELNTSATWELSMISKKQFFAILPSRLIHRSILCVSLSGAVLAGVASSLWISLPAQAQDTPADALDAPYSPDLTASGPSTSNPGASSTPDQSEWIQSWVNDLQQTSQQWIQIDLSDQQLTAWEGNTPVFTITVSTGRETDITPTGVFAIQSKYRTARMQGESQGKRYDIPDVPYTMYFSGSYAIHGAYWHSDFGSPVSSGCINVPIEGAAWLYDWAQSGTTVLVQN